MKKLKDVEARDGTRRDVQGCNSGYVERRWGCSKDSVARERKAGTIWSLKVGPRHYWFDKDEIDNHERTRRRRLTVLPITPKAPEEPRQPTADALIGYVIGAAFDEWERRLAARRTRSHG